MNMGKFFLLTGAGSLIWNFALVYVGLLAGESMKITDYLDVYAKFALAVLILLFIILVCVFYKKKIFKSLRALQRTENQKGLSFLILFPNPQKRLSELYQIFL